MRARPQFQFQRYFWGRITLQQITELIGKVQRLNITLKNIDVKLAVIKERLQKIAAQQAKKTPTQNFIEAISKLF